MDTQQTPCITARYFKLEVWDFPGIECWLAAQAAKGLHFHDRDGVLIHFEKGAPKAVRYRLDAISPLSPAPDDERSARNAEMGWRYVEQLADFSVYVCEDQNAPEFHTDPVAQSYTMDKLARKLRWELTLYVATLLVIAFLTAFFARSGVALTNYSVANLLVAGANVLLILNTIFQGRRFLRLRKRLRAGLPVERREGRRFSSANTLFLILMLCALFFLLRGCAAIFTI